MSYIPLSDLESLSLPPADSAWGVAAASAHADFKSFVSLYADRVRSVPDEDRLAAMRSSNPAYVLRNWMAQRAIETAEGDDFSEVRRLLRVLRTPFERQEEAEAAGYARPPPKWSRSIRVSCSS